MSRTGLVLSGGGAKGAYQAGVLRALAERGIEVDAVSGASIGALNGAMVASASSMSIAADRLEKVWNELAVRPVFAPNYPAYLRLLVGMGQTYAVPGWMSRYASLVASFKVVERLTEKFDIPVSLFTDEPLHKLLDEYLDQEALANGRPLWVSVFRSEGIIEDIGGDLAAMAGASDTNESRYVRIQDAPAEQRKEWLLASAALPLIFKRRRIEESFWSDGGQGGWSTQRGNTPITPLLDQGYDVIYVSHLANGSFWSRPNGDENTIVVELRPREAISHSVTDMVGFDHERITRWQRQGYEETHQTLDDLDDVLRVRHARLAATSVMEKSVAKSNSDVDTLLARVREKPRRKQDA